MIKEAFIREALIKLGLPELIGTSFEKVIKLYKLDKGDIILDREIKQKGAVYIVSGRVQRIIYTKEGREFYLSHVKGDITGIDLSLINKGEKKQRSKLAMDIVAKKSSIILFIPFEKLDKVCLDGENRAKIMEKIIDLSLRNYYKVSEYLLLKNTCTNEEFIINYLEKSEIQSIKSSRERAELLNINQRSLQRILKKLHNLGYINYKNGYILLKDVHGLKRYRESLQHQ